MTKLRTFAAVAAVAAMLLVMTGCQMAPWLAWFFAKPEKVEPVCTIPPDVKMLVLISDLELSETADCAAIKRSLTENLNEQLLEHEVATEVVSYEELLDFIAAEPTFHQLSFGEIAEKLGADLVLYVRLKQFKLRDTAISTLWRGELDVRVKLVDKNDITLFPVDTPLGHAARVEFSDERDESETYGATLTDMLGSEMADRIAKLFYQHEVPPGTKAQQQREEAVGDDV